MTIGFWLKRHLLNIITWQNKSQEASDELQVRSDELWYQPPLSAGQTTVLPGTSPSFPFDSSTLLQTMALFW
jgi:hypothetical protein